MTDLYLALGGAIANIVSSFDREPTPTVLCSYAYFSTMRRLLNQPTARIRYWVLDSGAYTAHKQGKVIDVDTYIDFCKRQLDGPNPPKEIYALDVIGDHKASLKNTERMWKAGVQAIPTFHLNEPEDALDFMAKEYPKIALGGVAGMGTRALPWLKQCFARIWPHRVHLFGIQKEAVLLALPFESADSSSWQMGPTAFGHWNCYDGRWLSTRSGFHLRPQVDHMLDLERKLKAKWRVDLARLGKKGRTP